MQISIRYVGFSLAHNEVRPSTPLISTSSSVKTRVQAESDAKKLQDARELPSPQVKRSGAPRKLTSAQKVRVRDVIRHVWREGVSTATGFLGAPESASEGGAAEHDKG